MTPKARKVLRQTCTTWSILGNVLGGKQAWAGLSRPLAKALQILHAAWPLGGPYVMSTVEMHACHVASRFVMGESMCALKLAASIPTNPQLGSRV